ncbi:MAG: DNA-protecting protein DprA [Candidatus Parabeggiatoa sp. nov. 3]|nr:MAG: DNA-protecting protein DprA [Gammaproteobacteria bacterium]RKZ64757.1 MAG: DNA-protecting protein DprA [Gammaproteobacteria bacterium]RKZ82595.1 MAG: DNA-protecting protein DprA [Gammaproteobacteria bacterium]HEW98531.1 DNA-protecting protein DprA [Beggiatoa sp.]
MKPKNTEQEYWIALLRAPGIGPINFARLVKHFGSPSSVFEAGREQWKALNMKPAQMNYLQNPNWAGVEKDIEWLAQADNHLLTLDHPDYPPFLREIDDAPPVLFVHGDYTLLKTPQLAIVGTRHPSSEGEQLAKDFAEYLSNQGFTITSGMALGIDGASHWGALAGTGQTIAVAGTGLDRVYPAKHRELAHQIAQTGALISELPIGTPVNRHNFPIRSRLVSGLSLGTLVIEAPERSGALYAAQHAAKQGRDVFAIPGSIHNPLVKGCHQLIKQGAKLVETAADILEELSNYQALIAQNRNHRNHRNQIKSTPKAKPTTPKQLDSSNKPIIEETEPSTNENPTTTARKQPKQPSMPVVNPSTLEKPKTNPVPQLGGEANDLDEDYSRLLEYLETGPTSIDKLVEQCGLTAAAVSSMLLILELRGLVAVQGGGLYARIG